MIKKGFVGFLAALIILSFPVSSFAFEKNMEISELSSDRIRPNWTSIEIFQNSFDISLNGKSDDLAMTPRYAHLGGGRFTIPYNSSTPGVAGTYYFLNCYDDPNNYPGDIKVIGRWTP